MLCYYCYIYNYFNFYVFYIYVFQKIHSKTNLFFHFDVIKYQTFFLSVVITVTTKYSSLVEHNHASPLGSTSMSSLICHS